MGVLRGLLKALSKDKDISSTFTSIYENKRWGVKRGEKFNSGTGSDYYISQNFVDFTKKYISENNITSMVDLGCGDFRVGQQYLSPQVKKYIGVDVVDTLIQHHQKEYADDVKSFECLDIINDTLPKAELCVIRQVLQHLSNDQVQQILIKLRDYKYILVCDHVPGGEFTPNKDKKHGEDIRLKDNSGLVFNAAPFNEKIKVVDTFVLDKFADGTSKLLTWVKDE
ncbi:MAG: SAM-dependent methyltransferase [Flavobacteriales bacterium]|nr:SAM-dependent methyltransferase [Flavobacteriales bacterium]